MVHVKLYDGGMPVVHVPHGLLHGTDLLSWLLSLWFVSLKESWRVSSIAKVPLSRYGKVGYVNFVS